VERVKSFFSKMIPYVGMFGALLAILSVFMGDSFRIEEMSSILVSVTVLVIYAIFNIIFNKNHRIKVSPKIDSGAFLFGLSMLALLGIFVRMLALMLLDVDIMGKHALITYIYSAVSFSFVYVAGRLAGNHKSGLISALMYALLCSFDVYPAVQNIKNGEPKSALICQYSGTVIILLSYVIALIAVKSNKSGKTSALCTVSGVVMGAAVFFHKNAFLAALGIIVMFAVTRNIYKYIDKDNLRSKQYKSFKYVLLFAAGFIVTAGIVFGLNIAFGMGDSLPQWLLYLKETNGVNDIFRHLDSTASVMWCGVYFERNRFITYISLLLYVFCLVMGAVGCLAASKSKNVKVLPCIIFPILLTVFGIAECGDVSYICTAIPFIIVIAGYGMSNSVNIVYVRNTEMFENNVIVPSDVMEKESEEFEQKYVLPKGSSGVPVVPNGDEFIDEDDEIDEDEIDGEDADEFEPDEKKNGDVVSGENLDNMLDNLYGVSDEVSPKDSVVIFKDVIK